MKCHFCGLREGQVVRVNGGGKVVVHIVKTKDGDNICGYCRLRLLRT